MGNKPLDSIDDLIRNELDLRVACQKCGHAATLNTITLRERHLHGSRRRTIRAIADRLVCSSCGGRHVATVPRERG